MLRCVNMATGEGRLLLPLLLLLLLLLPARTPAQPQHTGPVIYTAAVVGGRANLPCSLSSDTPGDVPMLVLWYLGASGTPIYSFDSRGKPLSEASQQSVGFILADREVEFRVTTAPPVLAIDDVRETDAAMYRCRVDFRQTPTRYSFVNLTVIVPPTPPVIRLPGGNRVGDILGPLTEGDPVQLICETRGGRPTPTLSWWRGPTLVSNAHQLAADGALQSVLTLPAISRADVDQTLSCHASNNNISQPLSRQVLLKTYFMPLYVRLEGSNQPLSLGRVHHVTCKTAGSRPQPQITWWMNEKQLLDHTIQTSLDGNETVSVLALNASRQYNGRHLICRVRNPEMAAAAIEDAWRITVNYPPEVTLSLGRRIQPSHLKEGDDVYMECSVRANPHIYKIEWLHNGELMQQSAGRGVLMSNMSLVMQGVSRRSSGHYACRVANSEGETVSNPIRLTVQHAPVCRSSQRREYHVAKHEQVTIPCQVDSDPPHVTFRWWLNNSVEVMDIGSDRFHAAGTVSELTITPSADTDFGTLVCSSSNQVGPQLSPCLFHIVPVANPVGAPETPTSCAIRNRTQASLHITCTAGAAGGYSQVFHLEAYQSQTHVLLSNVSSRRPEFVLGGLAPGEAVVVHVYSVSERGKSGLVTLEADTLKVAELKTRQEVATGQLQMTPLLAILLGAVVALLLVALAVVFTLRRLRARRRLPPHPHIEPASQKMLSLSSLDHQCVDDKSPDVVPCTSTLLDRRKAGGAYSQLRRCRPPAMPSVCQSVAADDSLPRRLAGLGPSGSRLGGEMHSFSRPTGANVFTPCLSDFPRAPALSTELYLPFDHSTDQSEADTKELDSSWQESVV